MNLTIDEEIGVLHTQIENAIQIAENILTILTQVCENQSALSARVDAIQAELERRTADS